MLFLHAVVLFVLGTFAVAIPVSPETSSFAAISRREKEPIDKSRIVGYWRTPVSESGSPLFSKAHINDSAFGMILQLVQMLGLGKKLLL